MDRVDNMKLAKEAVQTDWSTLTFLAEDIAHPL